MNSKHIDDFGVRTACQCYTFEILYLKFMQKVFFLLLPSATKKLLKQIKPFYSNMYLYTNENISHFPVTCLLELQLNDFPFFSLAPQHRLWSETSRRWALMFLQFKMNGIWSFNMKETRLRHNIYLVIIIFHYRINK